MQDIKFEPRFNKKLLAVVLCVVLLWTGCTASWIDIALKDIPVVIQIVQSIVQIVSTVQGTANPQASALVSTIGQKAISDLQTAQKLYNDYQAATATAKPGIVGQINAALTAGQTDINSMLDAAQIKDSTTRATITAAVGLAISTVMTFETLLPQPTNAKKAVLPKKPPSPNDLKKQYNTIVGPQFPSAVIH